MPRPTTASLFWFYYNRNNNTNIKHLVTSVQFDLLQFVWAGALGAEVNLAGKKKNCCTKIVVAKNYSRSKVYTEIEVCRFPASEYVSEAQKYIWKIWASLAFEVTLKHVTMKWY